MSKDDVFGKWKQFLEEQQRPNRILTTEERTPLKEGYIRLYHNTSAQNLQLILKFGLDPSKNTQQSEGSITWLTTDKCSGYGGNTIFVDMPIDDVKPYQVNDTQFTYPKLIDASLIHVCEVPIFWFDNGSPYRTSQVIGFINQVGAKEVLKNARESQMNISMDNWNKYIEPLL